MRRRVVGGVVLAVALGLSAAGCGADSPKPGPVVESSKSDPSTRSSVGADDGPESGTTLIRSYLQSLTMAAKSGDTAELRRFGKPSCESCEGVADRIDQIYSAGGRISGGSVTPAAITYEKQRDRFKVSLKIARQLTFTKPDVKPQVQPQTSIKALFYLERNQSGLTIADWTRL